MTNHAGLFCKLKYFRKPPFTPGPLFIAAPATSEVVRNQIHDNLFLEKRE